MSSSVDNRVVSMEFDNAKFERNVKESLDTLKHLDKSLDGLSNSSKRFDGVSFEQLAASIDSIANRFTLMGRITQKVFDEIATGIVNLGKKLITFNTDQLVSGWDKYADKTTSVQTIMSATGMSIDEVSEQLERLNRFTDETSYSFTDMTSNIAKFTSQGIGLETAVTQMQGIATWAASAGQNAQAASRAMYNIAQAMGAGSMKLIDWKSIQNANMATKEFKEQAIAAGVAAETLVEQEGKIVVAGTDIEVTTKNFEQTLQKGWFNSEAMSSVFNEYGKFADEIDGLAMKSDGLVSELLRLMEAEANGTLTTEQLEKALGDTDMTADELRAEIHRLNGEEYKLSKASYKAAQEAKTWGDALSAAADAISTAWMNVYETIFGNYEVARKLWTDVAEFFYDIFAAPIVDFNDNVLKPLMEGTGETEEASGTLQTILGSTGKAGDKYGGMLETVLRKSGMLTDEMIEEAGGVDKAIAGITGDTKTLQETIDSMLASNTASAITGSDALEKYKKVGQEILNGDWGNGAERKNALEKAGFDVTTAQVFADLIDWQKKYDSSIQITEDNLWRLGDSIDGSVSLTDDQRAALLKLRAELGSDSKALQKVADDFKYASWTGRELLFANEEDTTDAEGNIVKGKQGALYNLMNTVRGIQEAMSNAWTEIFGGEEDRIARLRSVLVTFNKFTAGILEAVTGSDKLQRVFQGLFSVLSIVKSGFSAFGTVLKAAISLFTPAGEGVGELAAKFGDWLVGIKDWLENNKIFEKAATKMIEGLVKIRDALDPAINKVKELWKAFKENDGIKKVSQLLGGVFKAAIDIAVAAVSKLVEWFGSLSKSISDFYNKHLSGYVSKIQEFFASWNVNSLADAIEFFKNKAIDAFTKATDAIKDFFAMFKNFIKTGDWDTFVKEFTERFEGLVTWFNEMVAKFDAFLKKLNIDPSVIKNVLKLVAALTAFLAVMKLLNYFGSVKGAFINLLNTLSNGINAFVRNYKVNTVVKIAASIVTLVGALMLLGNLETAKYQQGMEGLISIMTMMLAMMIVAAAAGKFANPQAAMGFGTAVVGIAATIGAAALALWVLTNKVDYGKIWQSLGSLFLVLAMAVGGVIAISHFAGPAKIQVASIVAMAAAMLIMVYTLEKLQNSGNKIKVEAFTRLAAILLVLGFMSRTLANVKFSSALGLLLFVATLPLINAMLRKFMDSAITLDEIKEHLEELAGIFSLLFAFALIARVGGGGTVKVVNLIAMIAAIFVLAKEVEVIGKIPIKQLAKGTAVVVALGLMIGAIEWLTASAGGMMSNNKAALGAIKSTVTAVIALGIVLVILSAMGWQRVIPAMAAIVLVLGGLTLVLHALKPVCLVSDGVKAKGASVLKAIALLVAVGVAIAALQNFTDASTVVQTAAALGIALVAIGAALYLIGNADFAKMNVESGITMLLDSIILLAEVFLALYLLDQMELNTSTLLPKVASFSILLIALGAAIAIMNTASTNIESAMGNAVLLIAAAAAMFLIVEAMKGLENVPIEGLLPKVLALSGLMLAMSLAVGILGAIPNANGFFGTLGSLTTVVIGIGEFALLAWGLVEIGAMEKLAAAADIIGPGFGAIGDAIGSLIGGFVGGMINSALTALAGVKDFATQLEPLITQLQKFDDSSLEALGLLTALVLTLTAGSFLDGINILGGLKTALDKVLGTDLASRLSDLGKAVGSYIESVKGYSVGDVNKAAKITEAMGTLFNALDAEGGMFDWFTGNKSTALKNLKDNLGGDEGFGAAMKSFIESVKGIEAGDIVATDNVVKIVEKLSSIMDMIGKSGGLLQELTGEANIGVFGQRILSFVRCLTGGEVDGKSEEGILELVKDLPDDTSDFDKLKEVTEKMAAAVGSIPTLGGLIDDIFGTNDPSVFGEKIVEFIKQIKVIGEEAKNITPDMVESLNTVVEAAKAVYQMAGVELPDVSVEAATEVSGAATEIKTGTDDLATMDAAAASSNMSILGEGYEQLLSIFSGAGGEEGFNFNLSGKEGITSWFSGITEGLSEHVGEAKEGMLSFGTEMLSSFTGDEMSGEMESILSEFTGNISTKLESSSAEAEAAGTHYAEGFAKGISEHIGAVQSAVQALADAATRTLTVTLAISSPSKVTTGLGKYFGEGFGIGIKNMIGFVSNQSEGIAEAAIDAVSTASRLASDIIERDANPVITPVLDLTEVRNGARAISGIGGFSATVNASSARTISGINSANRLAAEIQNGTPTPATAVLSDAAISALMSNGSRQQVPIIEFTGELAPLAKILHPHIRMQDVYHGKSLVK